MGEGDPGPRRLTEVGAPPAGIGEVPPRRPEQEPADPGPDTSALPRNLTEVGAPSATSSQALPRRPEREPYDPGQDREKVRGRIAEWLVGTLVGVVTIVVVLGLVLSIVCAFRDSCSTETEQIAIVRTIVELVLTPLVALVGAVTGFYYGEKAGSANGSR